MLERIVDSLFRLEKIIVEGMLHGPEALLVPKDDKTFEISFGVVGDTKKELGIGFF